MIGNIGKETKQEQDTDPVVRRKTSGEQNRIPEVADGDCGQFPSAAALPHRDNAQDGAGPAAVVYKFDGPVITEPIGKQVF